MLFLAVILIQVVLSVQRKQVLGFKDVSGILIREAFEDLMLLWTLFLCTSSLSLLFIADIDNAMTNCWREKGFLCIFHGCLGLYAKVCVLFCRVCAHSDTPNVSAVSLMFCFCSISLSFTLTGPLTASYGLTAAVSNLELTPQSDSLYLSAIIHKQSLSGALPFIKASFDWTVLSVETWL